MVTLEVVLDADVIDAVIDAATRSPRAVDALVNKSLKGDLERRLVRRLSVEPGPVRYPIAWTSERQRKAFFASDGFGAGIPTGRSGRVARGWQLTGKFANGRGEFIVENPVEYAQFVYLPDQQQFHANTGWMGQQEIDVIVLEESEWANDQLTEAWFSIAEFEGRLA